MGEAGRDQVERGAPNARIALPRGTRIRGLSLAITSAQNVYRSARLGGVVAVRRYSLETSAETIDWRHRSV